MEILQLFFSLLLLNRATGFVSQQTNPRHNGAVAFATPVEDGDPNGVSRRQAAELTFAAVGLGVSFLGTREVDPQDYGLWGILPVGTYKKKKTIRETIVQGKLWTFDQKFGILDVQVPLRMT